MQLEPSLTEPCTKNVPVLDTYSQYVVIIVYLTIPYCSDNANQANIGLMLHLNDSEHI